MWSSYGCQIIINTSDVLTLEGCRNLLSDAKAYGEIAGIFNLAVVLRDAIMANQTVEMFSECCGPKVAATHYLDILSREMCPNLKFFVVFSSLACGRGSAGQSNYGMANAIMERIIEQRTRDQLPGKAIQWGAIGDVGIVAEMLNGDNTKELLGTLPQRIGACLLAMDKLLACEEPIVASMQIPAKKKSTEKLSLVENVFNILGITDNSTVPMHSTLSELGMDSLRAIETSQMLDREFNITLANHEAKLLSVDQLHNLSDK